MQRKSKHNASVDVSKFSLVARSLQVLNIALEGATLAATLCAGEWPTTDFTEVQSQTPG